VACGRGRAGFGRASSRQCRRGGGGSLRRLSPGRRPQGSLPWLGRLLVPTPWRPVVPLRSAQRRSRVRPGRSMPVGAAQAEPSLQASSCFTSLRVPAILLLSMSTSISGPALLATTARLCMAREPVSPWAGRVRACRAPSLPKCTDGWLQVQPFAVPGRVAVPSLPAQGGFPPAPASADVVPLSEGSPSGGHQDCQAVVAASPHTVDTGAGSGIPASTVVPQPGSRFPQAPQ
jgi:hypothetical protein